MRPEDLLARLEAGYEYDPMYGQLCNERDKLKAENAKLRNEVDNLLDFEHLTSVAVAYAGCDECGEYKQTMLRLFAENAKLRALLIDAFVEFVQPYGNADDVYEYSSRMREVGIEV